MKRKCSGCVTTICNEILWFTIAIQISCPKSDIQRKSGWQPTTDTFPPPRPYCIETHRNEPSQCKLGLCPPPEPLLESFRGCHSWLAIQISSPKSGIQRKLGWQPTTSRFPPQALIDGDDRMCHVCLVQRGALAHRKTAPRPLHDGRVSSEARDWLLLLGNSNKDAIWRYRNLV